ncbi:MAG: porin [Bacteroidetes bacterium]|nr:porin [Bacteroidota bacterium]
MDMKKGLLLVIFQIGFQAMYGQQDSASHKPSLDISGILDVYYGYDFNKPANHELPWFLFSYRRHNEVNLNLGLVKLAFDGGRYRANLGLAAGNYPEYNLSGEPASLRHVYEANAGLSLGQQNKLWLDAGIFGSHVCFESLIAHDNWTLTHSILFENTPAYLAGAKLTWQPSDAWTLMGLVSNGWQRIYRAEGNSFPAFGSQVTYSASGTTLNWSAFVSSDDPDSLRRLRIFNDFFGKFQVTETFGVIVGFDVGLQQVSKGSGTYRVWYTPVLVQRQAIGERWAAALRLEYYADEHNVVIPTPGGVAFKTVGASLNVDFSPYKNVLLRMEGRWLNSENPVFEMEHGLGNSLGILMASLAVRFP